MQIGISNAEIKPCPPFSETESVLGTCQMRSDSMTQMKFHEAYAAQCSYTKSIAACTIRTDCYWLIHRLSLFLHCLLDKAQITPE